ncbi:unnamed protein product [Clonostachys solani]|uniref:Uncharacterized protein n=1 Tax=Clonostachys solani TaxID=160281 RepID=A0A9N9Z019_9HYPO|nr:unnamed protein product [Clonostachys solani]
MVAIKNLTIVLVGLAGLTTAYPTERDMESQIYLNKRIACTSGNCKIPSTFGSKHKVAGALRARYEDGLYERDDIDALLERRFVRPNLGVPTASSPKSWRRDEREVSLGKRFTCNSSHCKLPSNGNKIIKKRYEPEVSLGKRFTCTSSHCKLPSNGNKIIKKRYEPELSLGKRIACPSGNCRIPSTFGKKHKLAGAVAKRHEDAIYKRDDVEAFLQSRGTGSRYLKTLKNHFLP